MPIGNVQNYPGGMGGVDIIGGSPATFYQVYNNTGSDLKNGAVVVLSYQFDSSGAYFLVPATPATSAFGVRVGVIQNMDPNNGSPYAGIKNGHLGYVQTFGYCAVISIGGAVTVGDYINATNGQTYITDTASDSAKTVGTIGTTVSSGQYNSGNGIILTDGFLKGDLATI